MEGGLFCFFRLWDTQINNIPPLWKGSGDVPRLSWPGWPHNITTGIYFIFGNLFYNKNKWFRTRQHSRG